jgi:hypothetical protein
VNGVERPTSHIGYVQTVQRGGYFAVCPRCGVLQTPNRATIEEVKQDLAHHIEDVTAAYIAATRHLYEEADS